MSVSVTNPSGEEQPLAYPPRPLPSPSEISRSIGENRGFPSPGQSQGNTSVPQLDSPPASMMENHNLNEADDQQSQTEMGLGFEQHRESPLQCAVEGNDSQHDIPANFGSPGRIVTPMRIPALNENNKLNPVDTNTESDTNTNTNSKKSNSNMSQSLSKGSRSRSGNANIVITNVNSSYANEDIDNGPVVYRGDLKRLAALSKEQEERLSLLNNRIERLRSQEQRCWKDITVTQQKSKVLEKGDVTREEKIKNQEHIYEEQVMQKEVKKQQALEIRNDILENKDVGKQQIHDQNVRVAEQQREIRQIHEYECHVRRVSEIQEKQQNVDILQKEKKIVEQELKQKKTEELRKIKNVFNQYN